MPEDYYALLGVEPDASEEAILRAYRRKAAEHHPDVSDEPGADETFRRLNRAKRVLTDEATRRKYDRLGHDQYVGRTAGGSNPPRTDRPSKTHERREWAAGGPSGVESLLAAVFGGGGPHATTGRRWSGSLGPFAFDLDSWFEAVTTHDTAVRADVGTTRRSSGTDRTREDCPKCRGRGTFVHDIDTARGSTRRLEPCEQCGGAGTVPA